MAILTSFVVFLLFCILVFRFFCKVFFCAISHNIHFLKKKNTKQQQQQHTKKNTYRYSDLCDREYPTAPVCTSFSFGITGAYFGDNPSNWATQAQIDAVINNPNVDVSVRIAYIFFNFFIVL